MSCHYPSVSLSQFSTVVLPSDIAGGHLIITWVLTLLVRGARRCFKYHSGQQSNGERAMVSVLLRWMQDDGWEERESSGRVAGFVLSSKPRGGNGDAGWGRARAGLHFSCSGVMAGAMRPRDKSN